MNKKKLLVKTESWTDWERKQLFNIGRLKSDRTNVDSDYVEYWTSSNHTEICKFIDSWYTIIQTDRWNQSRYYLADEFEEVLNWLNTSFY